MAQQGTTNGRICAEEYTVKRGDSFYLIAHKLGVPLRDLLAANSNIHPARLMVGDVLCVPREEDDSAGGLGSGSAGSTGSNGNGGSTGTVNGSAGNAGNTGNGSGSTGSTGSTGTSGSTGATGNGNISGGTGSAGGSVTGGIPGSGGGTDSGSTITGSPSGTTPSTPATPTTPQCPLDEQLIVQRGQTVADIQLLNLVSRHTLESANPDVNLDALRVGQTLCVPKENVACEVPTTYTLGTTENLEAVAVQFNLPVASILRANPCLAPQDFEAGITVVIPQ